jgi:hypothetical protein
MKRISQKGVKDVKDVALGSKAKFRSAILLIPHNKFKSEKEPWQHPSHASHPSSPILSMTSSEGV